MWRPILWANLAALQALIFDGQSLDHFAFFNDGGTSPKAGHEVGPTLFKLA